MAGRYVSRETEPSVVSGSFLVINHILWRSSLVLWKTFARSPPCESSQPSLCPCTTLLPPSSLLPVLLSCPLATSHGGLPVGHCGRTAAPKSVLLRQRQSQPVSDRCSACTTTRRQGQRTHLSCHLSFLCTQGGSPAVPIPLKRNQIGGGGYFESRIVSSNCLFSKNNILLKRSCEGCH